MSLLQDFPTTVFISAGELPVPGRVKEIISAVNTVPAEISNLATRLLRAYLLTGTSEG